MRNALNFISILLVTSIGPALACHKHGGFVPINDMKIPHTQKTSGLSEKQYHEVIDRFEKIWVPVVKEWGADLILDRKWESTTVNAGTFRDEGGKHWHVNLYGGFARHPAVTEDAYTLVLCHELGHHIGGAPKKLSTRTAKWSSNEGQADYFATLKCLRTLFEKDDNVAAIQAMRVPETVMKACDHNFKNKNESALCQRSNMAALSANRVSTDLQGSKNSSFDTPDPNKTNETIERHPRPQCRLDTYFAGTICEVGHQNQLSQNDEIKGTCDPYYGHNSGTRPQCWYRPGSRPSAQISFKNVTGGWTKAHMTR